MVVACNETSKRMLDRDKDVKATPPFNTQDSDWRKLVIIYKIQLKANAYIPWSWHGSPLPLGGLHFGVTQPPKKVSIFHSMIKRERERARFQRTLQLVYSVYSKGSVLDATITGKRVNPRLFLRQAERCEWKICQPYGTCTFAFARKAS